MLNRLSPKRRWIDPDIGAVVVIYLGGCLLSLGFFAAVVWIFAAAIKWVMQ